VPLVAIDPGHGGADSGATGVLPPGTVSGLPARVDRRGRNAIFEKDVTLDVARRLQRWLRAQGYPTVMTRTTDRAGGDVPYTTVGADLAARVRVANERRASLFVSIHMNSSRHPTANGAETFHFRIAGPEAQGLARAVQRGVLARTGFADRGVKQAGFYVLRHTAMPAVLVEGGFLSNPAQALELSKPLVRARIAAGVGEGLAAYVAAGGEFGPVRPRYRVDAGMFRKRALAQQRRRLVARRGFDAIVVSRYSRTANRNMFFVVAGQFAVLANAVRLRADMRAAGLPARIGPA
jgi:N-acetylmuramoyl-L-alanine amidase